MTQGDLGQSVRIRSFVTLIGALGLISIVAGGFGEAFVPAAIIDAEDASATAANIAVSQSLLRGGFAAYLVEALCDVTLTMLFFELFRVVGNDVALVGVFFRLIGTGGFAMAHIFFFASLPTVVSREPLRAFTGEQLDAMAMLFIRISQYAQTVFTMFYGVGTLLFGYLIYRCGFLPAWIGVLVMLGSSGFIAKAATWVLLPAASSPLLLVPAAVAFSILSVWMIVKGIDVTVWRAKAELDLTGKS